MRVLDMAAAWAKLPTIVSNCRHKQNYFHTDNLRPADNEPDQSIAKVTPADGSPTPRETSAMNRAALGK